MRQLVLFIECLIVASFAFAQDLTMTSVTHSLKVSLAPLVMPTKDANFVVVSWENLPSAPKSGAMIYQFEGSAGEKRYFAVGGVGYFSFLDRNEKTLVNGSAIPVYRLTEDDPQHPIEMQVNANQRPKPEDLQAAYRSFQGLASDSADKAEVEKTLAAAAKTFQNRCGGKPSFRVEWENFSKTGHVWLASSAGAVALGLADKCAEAVYKVAIAKIKTISVSENETLKPSDLTFKHSGSNVEISVGKTVMNPRQRAEKWIGEEL